MSKDAVRRHKTDHLPRAVVQAKQVEEVLHGTDLVSEVQDLNDRTLAIPAEVEKSPDLKIALRAIAEVRKNEGLLARLKGELEQKQPQVTANLNVQMIRAEVETLPRPFQEFIADHNRLTTDMERQELLVTGDNNQTDEPPE